MIDPDDDDGREVTWDEEHSLPSITPTRPEGEHGLPLFDIDKMVGRRNRVFCVRGHPWTNYWNQQFTYKWSGRAPLSWEEGLMPFLEQILHAAGKEMNDLFHEGQLTEDLPLLNLRECDGGQAEEKSVVYANVSMSIANKIKEHKRISE